MDGRCGDVVLMPLPGVGGASAVVAAQEAALVALVLDWTFDLCVLQLTKSNQNQCVPSRNVRDGSSLTG